jgi:hypothetical protein
MKFSVNSCFDVSIYVLFIQKLIRLSSYWNDFNAKSAKRVEIFLVVGSEGSEGFNIGW